jgi:hypothetical protein
MAYHQPPAHVQELSSQELHQLRGSDQHIDPLIGRCSQELSNLLSLSPLVSASPTVEQAAKDLAAAIQQILVEREALARQSAPLGREVGAFSYSDGEVRFTLTSPLSVDQLACKALGIYAPSGLSAGMIDSLIEANSTSSPVLREQLSQLRTHLTGSSTQPQGTFVELPVETVLMAPKEMHALLAEAKTRSALTLVHELKKISASLLQITDSNLQGIASKSDYGFQVGDLPSPERLSEMHSILEKSLILARVNSLTQRVTMDASRFLAKATNTVTVFTPRSEGDITNRFKDLFTLRTEVTNVPDTILSKEESATLLTTINSSMATLMVTHRDSHLIRAQYLANKGDIPTLLKEYRAATLYEDVYSSLSPETPSLREKIRSDCYGALLQGYARLPTPPDEREFKNTKLVLDEIFPVGESYLVLHDALQTVRGNLLSEDPSPERSVHLGKIQGYSNSLLSSAVSAQDLQNIPISRPFLGTESERITAVKTLVLEIKEACERRDFKKLSALDSSLSHLIRDVADKGAKHAFQCSVLCNLSEYLLRFKEVREGLPATLHACDCILPTTEVSSKNTQMLLSTLGNFDPTLFPSKNLDFIQEQFYSTTTSAISIATHATLSYSVLHADTAEEKLERFNSLKQLYTSTQIEELEQLMSLTYERNALEQSKIPTDTLQSPLIVRATQGKLLALNASISRLSRSIVANAVELSTLALQARHPTLSKEARIVIDQIPKITLRDQEGKELLERFRKYHHSDSALLSALREFLEQSVRDKPMYTFGFMFAAGLLGAGLASRRNRGKAFLLGSSGAMLATKMYCVATGIPMIQEAFASQFSYATPLTSALDALYLFTDIAQASLLVAALRNLTRSETIPSHSSRGSLASIAKDELVQFSKLALSQCNPRSLGFYLIGTPLTVGTYQILTSGLRAEEQVHQFIQLGYEVIPILLAALIHDRTKIRLDGPPSSPSENTEKEELPPLPKLPDV